MLVTRSMAIRLAGVVNWVLYLAHWLVAIAIAISPIVLGADVGAGSLARGLPA